MAYTNFESKSAGYAGQVSRGDQSMSRAWAETNNSDMNVPAGVFVAKHEEGGFRPIASADDVISGFLLRAALFPVTKPQEQGSIMHIGHGDGAWALIAEGAELARGDLVSIVATGADAGKLTSSDAEGSIATNYIVDRVSGDVADITRKEV